MDEADLLADHIAILAAPGKLVASGSPVALKQNLGEGYSIQVTFTPGDREKIDSAAYGELLTAFRRIAPETHTSSPAPNQVTYHLGTKDPKVVQRLLEFLDHDGGAFHVISYDILGTTIEDIFLDLMVKHNIAASGKPMTEKEIEDHKNGIEPGSEVDSAALNLTNGRPVSPFRQAFTIFHKRMLIAKRSWLTPLLTILIAVAGTCIPLVFITGKSSSCTRPLRALQPISLYLPNSRLLPFQLDDNSAALVSPPGLIDTLGPTASLLRVANLADQAAFVSDVQQNYRNLALGGVSLNTETNEVIFAWEADSPGTLSAAMLNLASNVLYNRALNATGDAARTPLLIRANYAPFPARAAGTLFALQWVFFFGAVMVSRAPFA